MVALLLIVFGVVMIACGARCAGSPGGFSADRNGVIAAAYPGVAGTARCPCAWFLGEVLENGGYVVLLVGVMATL